MLIGRDGKVVARFPSKVTPLDPKVTAAVEDALKQGQEPAGYKAERAAAASGAASGAMSDTGATAPGQ